MVKVEVHDVEDVGFSVIDRVLGGVVVVEGTAGGGEEEGDHESEDLDVEFVVFVDVAEFSLGVVEEVLGEEFFDGDFDVLVDEFVVVVVFFSLDDDLHFRIGGVKSVAVVALLFTRLRGLGFDVLKSG